MANFQEIAAAVDEAVYAVTGQQFAAAFVFRTRGFTTALVDGVGDFVQVAQLRLHRLSIGFEFVAAGIDFRNDLRHVWLPITPFH